LTSGYAGRDGDSNIIAGGHGAAQTAALEAARLFDRQVEDERRRDDKDLTSRRVPNPDMAATA